MKAWTFRYKADVEKKGEAANWYAGWVDPDGKRKSKSFGPGDKGKAAAARHCVKVEDRIANGTYQNKATKTWAQFRREYNDTVIANMTELRSAEAAKSALDCFERKMKPGLTSSIKSKMIEDFKSKRTADDGRGGRKLSKATINKELRYIRAACRVAHDWGYLPKVPRFKFFKLADKLPTIMPPEDFNKVYEAAGAATLPTTIKNVTAADYWRGILITAYATGWRIGAILSLKWSDVDLETGMAISRAEDNKGKRDVAIDLDPVVIAHLRKIEGSKLGGDTLAFHWPHSYRKLWTEFYALQDAAEVKPTGKAHYGFHDCRRAYATLNSANMDLFELQQRMQHKSLETTKLYVNMAARLKPAAGRVFIPTSAAAATTAAM